MIALFRLPYDSVSNFHVLFDYGPLEPREAQTPLFQCPLDAREHEVPSNLSAASISKYR